MSWLDEQRFLGSDETRRYGLVLWPASIVLALEISRRAAEFRRRRVLEVGAGIGLPGIVAAIVGASVVQTDRDEQALALCRRNAERNNVVVEHRLADWSAWTGAERYDWVIGSDILYRTMAHDQLRAIFERATAAGGRMLLADPLRSASVRLLERMAQDGWTVSMTRWSVRAGGDVRMMGVFELRRR